MISKNYKYNGDLIMKLTKKRFELYPIDFTKKFAVLYDISMDQFKKETLSVKIRKDKSIRINSKIVLKRMNTKILEVSVDAINFNEEKTENVLNELTKTIQIVEQCKCSSFIGIVEIEYKYDLRTKYTVLTNPEVNIHGVNQWLCQIWPLKYQIWNNCISTTEDIINETQSFVDRGSKVSINVGEGCLITPVTEDDCGITIPWNKNLKLMRQRLSIILKVEQNQLRLMNEKKNVMEETSLLEINDFRSMEGRSMPNLFYEVLGAKIKCIPLKEEKDVFEIMLVGEKTLSEIKKKIGWKLKIDTKLLIICGKEGILKNDEILSIANELKYCVGLPQENIGPKEFIGSGSFGKIWKTTDMSTMETIALKEYITSFDNKKKLTIIGEFLVLSSIPHHENIIRYYGIYVNDNDINIAMEYVEGGSLRQYLEINGPSDESEILRFSIDILKGLKHLHDNKINHRDIKGANILLGKNKIAKLCDFGISKILKEFGRTTLSKGIEQTANSGTFRWMAPEVINGETYCLKADIWSVGATLVEMITGKVPYDCFEEGTAIYHIGNEKKILWENPKPLSDKLRQFVDCCLEPDKIKRKNVDLLLSLPFFSEETYSL